MKKLLNVNIKFKNTFCLGDNLYHEYILETEDRILDYCYINLKNKYIYYPFSEVSSKILNIKENSYKEYVKVFKEYGYMLEDI